MPDYTKMNDELLADLARHGDRRALEQLLGGVRDWIYNVVRRVLLNPQESEDAVQEALVKIATNLARFDPNLASFRTWAYRIAVNHAANMKRGSMEQLMEGFDWYAKGLAETPDTLLPASELSSPENQLLIEEAKSSCTLGMLLCLDRDQRIPLILADLMGLPDAESAEMLGVSHDAFRKRLSRARRDLYQFMDDRCGLVNERNPCRCSRKMQAFARQGWIDPASPRFSAPHVQRLKEKVRQIACEHDDFNRPEYREIFRNHPHFEAPDKILKEILDRFSP